MGVRVIPTGEEGWIFGELVEEVAPSQLGGAVTDAGFRHLSEDFDRLVGSLGQQFGYRLFESVEQTSGDTLQVSPSTEFLLDAGGETHMTAALAIYEMWKNHQNGAPVAVVMLNDDGNAEYITVRDGSIGPQLTFETPTAAIE